MSNDIENHEKQRNALGFEGAQSYQPKSGYGLPRYGSAWPSPVKKEPVQPPVGTVSAEVISLNARISNQLSNIRRSAPASNSGASWLFDAILELESLGKSENQDDTTVATAETISAAISVVRLCSEERLPAPLVDGREGGEIEIFFRERDKGLFIVVGRSGSLQVFGDFLGEAWRARYEISGAIWHLHLRNYCRELIDRTSAHPLSVNQKY